MTGNILVAEESGSYLLRFVGDVRITLCAAFSEYLDCIFTDQNAMRSVVLDLSKASNLDSTTLGLMAKLALQARECGITPIIINNSPCLARLLESMGLDELFEIADSAEDTVHLLQSPAPERALSAGCKDPEALGRTILQSHRTLMELSSDNHNKFKDLVDTLEKQLG